MTSCEQYSLLKPKPANGFAVWAKDCIIFPLKNQDNKIISLYGRSTTNDKEQLPEGEDINSVLQNHDAPEILSDLIKSRIDFFCYSQHNHFLNSVRENASLSSIEKEKMHSSETIVTPVIQSQVKLNTQNPELLIYAPADGGPANGALYFEILGGIRITGLDRMKVTLKVQHTAKQRLPVRDTLDLYNRSQTEQLIQAISENFDVNITQTETAISELTGELENYRLEKIEALQPKEKQPYEMSPAARAAAMKELQKPNLLQRTGQLLMQCGIVGEQTNSLIAYLVYSTRKQSIPLHIMFLGSSGSGKTYLQERISELIPEEDKIEITQITENALYYFRQEELKNKLLLIEDLDGAMSVFYPLRELQTKRRISKTVTLKDSKGNLKTITLTVEDPVCVSGCTTREKIYEDNANRCLLLYTDQTRDQDRRINAYQTKIAAGEINREREQQYRELFKNMQRLLQPLNIINPYAKYIELPEQVFKPRRTMTLLLGFIEAITFYHQHQREVKRKTAGGEPAEPYIETTVEDIASAFALLKDVLFSKSDELSQATRSFFENLKSYLSENNQPSFTPQEIRKVFRVEPRTIQRYNRELRQYGFLRQVGGFKHRKGYEYTITDAEEYSQLKSGIDAHLETILTTLHGSTCHDSDSTATVAQVSQ